MVDSKTNPHDSEPNLPPLIKELTEKFKEPLSIIKNLQNIHVIPEESFSYPKIIVLGDQSVGKTSLVSTLIGVNLPRGLEIPLIIKFENHSSPCTKLYLRYQYQYKYVNVEVSEDDLERKILAAVKLVPEDNDLSISLIVKQQHVDGLTIIDFPGIHAYADKNQQKSELEVMRGYIRNHMGYDIRVFLNVISVLSVFDSCQSTKLVKEFDIFGTSTVTVMSKSDICSKDDIIRLAFTEVANPFGYVFIRNVIGGETIEEAKRKESDLFNSELFSSYENRFMGFGLVAKNLVLAMLWIHFNHRSPIVRNIEHELSSTTKVQSQEKFNTIDEAIPTFISIISYSQNSLYKLLVDQVYNDYREDKHMHSYERLVGFLETLYYEMKELKVDERNPFLVDEIVLLKERSSLHPFILGSPFSLIKVLLSKQIEKVSRVVNSFVEKVWEYVERVVLQVLLNHAKDYKQLILVLKRFARKVIEQSKLSFKKKVDEISDLETMLIYTCDPDFKHKVEKYRSTKLKVTDLEHKVVMIEGLGNTQVGHLKNYEERTWQIAYDFKMLVVAYWEVVSKRIVDNISLNLMISIKEMVDGQFVSTMIKQFKEIGEADDLKKSPVEAPMSPFNKVNLKKRTCYLVDTKKELEKLQKDFEFLRWYRL